MRALEARQASPARAKAIFVPSVARPPVNRKIKPAIDRTVAR